jgi:hypothetical protein
MTPPLTHAATAPLRLASELGGHLRRGVRDGPAGPRAHAAESRVIGRGERALHARPGSIGGADRGGALRTGTGTAAAPLIAGMRLARFARSYPGERSRQLGRCVGRAPLGCRRWHPDVDHTREPARVEAELVGGGSSCSSCRGRLGPWGMRRSGCSAAGRVTGSCGALRCRVGSELWADDAGWERRRGRGGGDRARRAGVVLRFGRAEPWHVASRLSSGLSLATRAPWRGRCELKGSRAQMGTSGSRRRPPFAVARASSSSGHSLAVRG